MKLQCSMCKNLFEYENKPPIPDWCSDCDIIKFKQETIDYLMQTPGFDPDELIARMKAQAEEHDYDEHQEKLLQAALEAIGVYHLKKLN